MDYVRGLDVSKYQTVSIDWDRLRSEGYRFVLIRASGPDRPHNWTYLEKDPHFDTHYERAGKAGFLRGAYHYLVPDLAQQAAFFVDTIGERKLELGYWGDVEDGGLSSEKCSAFFEALDRQIPRPAGIYSRASFLNGIKAHLSDILTQGGKRPLWVAHFDAERPTLPRGWDHWDFWQYTVTQVGVVPSIPGRVDLDYYCGDLAEFEAEFKRDPMDEIREQLRVIEEALARIRTLMP
jgi:GH25 family lysozyme M1 (1,4-beta-N-acetylmuramidase)